MCSQKAFFGGYSNTHNSLTNKARDLWSVVFLSSLLAISISITLIYPNSSKLYCGSNLNTPFLLKLWRLYIWQHFTKRFLY